jgi:hypothetical protein
LGSDTSPSGAIFNLIPYFFQYFASWENLTNVKVSWKHPWQNKNMTNTGIKKHNSEISGDSRVPQAVSAYRSTLAASWPRTEPPMARSLLNVQVQGGHHGCFFLNWMGIYWGSFYECSRMFYGVLWCSMMFYVIPTKYRELNFVLWYLR